MKKIKIADKVIGEGEPCFIIAEAGVNHNGDISLAKKLIDVAKEAGADAVKFQTFSADGLVTKTAPKTQYQKEATEEEESQYEMLKRLELTKDNHQELISYAKQLGILFLSTPFDEGSADLLAELKVPAFKVGSGEIINLPLLKHIAEKSLPMIISTGYSTLGEVEEGVKVIQETGNNEIILLHCTSTYPAAFGDINLRAMQTLRQAFQLLVGYSDHTLGIDVPLAAVALGAVVVEKHFTLDRNLLGPDHKASLEPNELKNMVTGIRRVEKALGSPIKKPVGSETEVRKAGRKSIVARTYIPKGTIITKDMLIVKRPGTGIYPKYLAGITGKKTIKNIEEDELIRWSDVRGD